MPTFCRADTVYNLYCKGKFVPEKDRMETYTLPHNLKVFGEQVCSFPLGIGETFEKLMKMLGGFNRSYYGISYMDPEGKIVYYAAAQELYEEEAEKYNCRRLVIEKGDYLCQPVEEWQQKTTIIKTVFETMIKTGCPAKDTPAIEWYKNERLMYCMIKKSGA